MIVNIIGSGEGWEDVLDDKIEGERWFINYFHPKAGVLFEIHPPDHPYHEKLRRERENARAAGIDLVTQSNYPLERIIEEIGTDYFGSSTDWAIAYCIFYEEDLNQSKQFDFYVTEPTEIHLWGVTMDDRGDHYEKRCATDFWCGVAIGRGIKVVVHGNSRVMTTEDGLTYGTFKPMKRRYRHES